MKLKMIVVALATLSAPMAQAGGFALQLSTSLGKIGGDPAPVGQEYKKVAPAVGVQYTNTVQDKWVNRYTVGVSQTITGKTTPYLQATSEYKFAEKNGYTFAAGLGTQVKRQYTPDNESYKTKASLMPVASVTRDNMSLQMAYVPATKVDQIKIPGQVMLSLNVGLDGFFSSSKSSSSNSVSSAPSMDATGSSMSNTASDMSGTYDKLPEGTAATGEIYAPLNTAPEDLEVYSPLKELKNDEEVYKPISFRSSDTAKARLAMLLN